MTCDKTRQLVSAYLDGELDDGLVEAVREHLEGCPACSDHLESLGRLRQTLSHGRDITAPSDLWSRIAREIDRTAPRAETDAPTEAWASHRSARRRLFTAAALLLAMVIPAYLIISRAPTNPTQDPDVKPFEPPPGLALAQYVQDMQSGEDVPGKFFDLHQRREVDLEELSEHVEFGPKLPTEVPSGLRLQKCYVLNTAGGNALGCEYVQGTRRMTFFQQRKGDPVLFEDLTQGCMDLNGIHCRCIMMDGIMVLNWESDGRNTTVVCNFASTSDLGEIIRSLLGDE